MSYIDEVFSETSRLNPNVINDNTDEKKQQQNIQPPKYDPIIPINDDNNKQTQPISSRESTLKNPTLDNNNRIEDSNNPDLNSLRKEFMYIYKNNPELKQKITSKNGEFERIYNSQEIMTTIITSFREHLNQQINQDNENNINNNHQNNNETYVNQYDDRSLLMRLWDEIKFPFIMCIIYYLINTKSFILYLNSVIPLFNEFYVLKNVIMTGIFFILSLIVEKIYLYIFT